MIGAAHVGTRDADRVRRYRQLLRAYPAAWRHEHGEVLLSTLLDVADQRSLDRPSLRQVLDISAHGAREHLREVGSIAPRRVTASVAAGSLIGVVLVLMATDMPMPRFAAPIGAEGAIATYGAAWLLTARFLLLARRGAAIATMLLAATISLWVPSVLADQSSPGIGLPYLSAYFVEAVLQAGPTLLVLPLALALVALLARPEARLATLSAAVTAVFAFAVIATSGNLLGLGQLTYSGHPATLPVSAAIIPIGVLMTLGLVARHAHHRRMQAVTTVALSSAPWAVSWTVAMLISLVVPVPILIYAA